MLELQRIRKTYDGQPLLNDLTLHVRDGETACLLGASGSGKSTLLRIIAGLELPEAGRVIWDGGDLADTPAHRRDFGLVFQDYALFPHLDVLGNVAFGLRMRDWSRPELEARSAEVLQLVNLSGFETRRVTGLSGGEQQRVALARALAPRPRLLMFDEPLAALDRTLRADLVDELRGILQKARVPAIYVTHDQEQAFAIADRVLILHQGRIVCEGTPAQVVARPGSAWAAGFLGLGLVLSGRLTRRHGKHWAVETALGQLQATCGAKRRSGEAVSLLIRPENVRTGERRGGLKSRVTGVAFERDGYRVALENGLSLKLERPPRLRERIAVWIAEVECLS
jgi:ABC-type Fe3+/spermidine/putrescine transport system ATPase subunit